MSATLVHRGPDSEGSFVDGGVGLAARRLAIIDLDGGDQPLANEDGSCTVVQNGEIYNYAQLTRELERLGHRFRTHSDTETIVHAYEQWGLDFAQRLRRLAAANMLANIEIIADARRPLLTYAALVLEHIIRVAKPKTIVFSTFGVREGLLYEMLPPSERAKDGFICAAQTLNGLLSRSARHAEELVSWTDRLVRVVKLRETEEDRRLRHVQTGE